jgi:TRAP-type C4-dicarboxylate transport system permease small subunit
MMAFVTPSAYRYAGFVAIEMVPDMMPKKIRALLMFSILLLATLVIAIMLSHAWAHFSAPLLFDSSGLNRLLQDSGINQLLGTSIEFKTAYIYLAMSVLLVIMLIVSAELILRQIAQFIWSEEEFPSLETPAVMVGD